MARISPVPGSSPGSSPGSFSASSSEPDPTRPDYLRRRRTGAPAAPAPRTPAPVADYPGRGIGPGRLPALPPIPASAASAALGAAMLPAPSPVATAAPTASLPSPAPAAPSQGPRISPVVDRVTQAAGRVTGAIQQAPHQVTRIAPAVAQVATPTPTDQFNFERAQQRQAVGQAMANLPQPTPAQAAGGIRPIDLHWQQRRREGGDMPAMAPDVAAARQRLGAARMIDRGQTIDVARERISPVATEQLRRAGADLDFSGFRVPGANRPGDQRGVVSDPINDRVSPVGFTPGPTMDQAEAQRRMEADNAAAIAARGGAPAPTPAAVRQRFMDRIGPVRAAEYEQQQRDLEQRRDDIRDYRAANNPLAQRMRERQAQAEQKRAMELASLTGTISPVAAPVTESFGAFRDRRAAGERAAADQATQREHELALARAGVRPVPPARPDRWDADQWLRGIDNEIEGLNRQLASSTSHPDVDQRLMERRNELVRQRRDALDHYLRTGSLPSTAPQSDPATAATAATGLAHRFMDRMMGVRPVDQQQLTTGSSQVGSASGGDAVKVSSESEALSLPAGTLVELNGQVFRVEE